MPSRQQMAAVVTRIEWLRSMSYIIDGGRVSGPVSDAFQPWWDDLDRAQQQTVLDEDVDWEGFTETEKLDVERRVLAGEDPEFWMDGVAPEVTPLERAEAEIRAVIEREQNRVLAPTDDLGLGDDWTVIGTFDLGKWPEWSEPQRLAALQEMVNWQGVHPADKRRLLEGAVDFSRIAADDQTLIVGDVWHNNDTESLMTRVEADGSSAAAAKTFIRPLTQQLIDCCWLDVWPGNTAVIDFGIDSAEHLGALQHAIRYGLVTAEELDAAMGNGEALTAIAQRGDNPYRDVSFHTSWDDMRLDLEPDNIGPHRVEGDVAPTASAYATATGFSPAPFDVSTSRNRAVPSGAEIARDNTPHGPEQRTENPHDQGQEIDHDR
jgi:hypothetical protein